MKTLETIKKELGRSKATLVKKYPIKSLAIFGSFARNEQTKDSDLDLLVDFNASIGIRFIDLAEEIENQLGLKIDLVSRNGVKEKYFKIIEEDLIYV
ncbi:putative nucleotidyltransferase [Aequorivita sublithincola DSM 14238]|uniref:Putative nucleotidyltransferase n=1 Tax=Aequorivita sublithincola (strain DSM 14238 / LMG 21431 / ACAM 643 / 9-3) TaxID=746697 RepID=I3YZP4_AEQSU|nr:nucleotidyltransferase family protein [Aequorivita sublithincola]AFL82462.1 putative nucleotidyltransferase [Aequorivita sublithincola DSM 14238]